ncbi:hypothetical protein [Acetobacter thailandicus]|uniref:hypothetical protein n=1 Tax=Acetobacter thailandicus TaxID=1502842 RepID=UPI001BACCC92|nr:hypothetical protein [Acetobacter thailandicus]MBS1003993.1 hypothetical protein [Acetobacter thailandicus]
MSDAERAQPIDREDTSLNSEDFGVEYLRKEMFPEVARVACVAERPDVSWARYIFRSEFAEHRHSKGMYSNRLRSAISILFDVMTAEERRAVMAGPYELGNGLPIPDDLRSYAALNRFLGYRDGQKGLNPLRHSIDQLSSLSFSEHLKEHPDISLKVIALLHRYKTGRDGSLAVPHLAQLLSLPGKKRPSLEINQWDASKEGRKISCVIDELIVHLESELDQECRNAVGHMVTNLTFKMGVAVDRIAASIKYRAKGRIETECALFEGVLRELSEFNPKDCYIRETAYRLDLDLLIYLHRLQIEHRNAANTETTATLSRLQPPVADISDAIIAFDQLVAASLVQRVKIREYLTASETREFINCWQSELQTLMQLAFKKDITSEEFVSARDLASAFSDDPTATLRSTLPTLKILTALCVAHADAIAPFRYTPFWHGQRTQARSAFHPVNKEGTFSRETIPEGRLVFWRECQKWIGASLIGQNASWDLHRRLNDRISSIISSCLDTHDVTFICSICKIVNDYADAQDALMR